MKNRPLLSMIQPTNSKAYLLLVAACSLLGLGVLTSCQDQNNTLGLEHLPEYTQSKSLTEHLPVSYHTLVNDRDLGGADGRGKELPEVVYNNIYVSSSYGYVGTIPNKEYGGITCDYLTQVRCPAGFTFGEEPLDHKVDSAFVAIYYTGYTGNGDAPLEISAYKLKKPLERANYKYSIGDISAYSDERELLGQTTFTASKGDGVIQSPKMPYILIPLSRDMGQEFYDLARAGSPHFQSQAAFDQYFPGMHLKISAGAGSVLQVAGTSLVFYYSVKAKVKEKNKEGKEIETEKVVARAQEMVHTSEVPQVARFANEGLDRLLQKVESEGSAYSFIKSPAGVITEVVLPIAQIEKMLAGAPNGATRQLNSIHYALKGINQVMELGAKEEDTTYALTSPSHLLLLPKDSLATFFSKELTPLIRPYTAFLSNRSSSTSLTYDFGNIASVVTKHMEDKANRGKDLHLCVVPVEVATSSGSSGGQSSSGGESTLSTVSHLVLPAAMKIAKKDDANSTIKVTIIERKVGSPF